MDVTSVRPLFSSGSDFRTKRESQLPLRKSLTAESLDSAR